MNPGSANLTLRVTLRDGAVAAVETVSPRADPSPIFVGLPPAEAATLAERLFSLCPAAQSLAAQAAGEAALGVEIDPAHRRLRALRLFCERLGEMLRSSLLDWPRDEAPSPHDLTHLRHALRILRVLPQSATQELIEPLVTSTAGLGLNHAGGASGFFAGQLAEARDDESHWELPPKDPDYLSAADDTVVSKAMMQDSAFSRTPALRGRCAETGAAARQMAQGGGLAARLAARFADMTATVESICALLQGGEAPEALLSARSEAPGRGFAAVDSARGRLYHALRIDRAGRIADYSIVAPTEWNFHPDGPFVRSLRGAKIGIGEAARRRVERLAFVFDPCIRATAEILDECHA